MGALRDCATTVDAQGKSRAVGHMKGVIRGDSDLIQKGCQWVIWGYLYSKLCQTHDLVRLKPSYAPFPPNQFQGWFGTSAGACSQLVQLVPADNQFAFP